MRHAPLLALAACHSAAVVEVPPAPEWAKSSLWVVEDPDGLTVLGLEAQPMTLRDRSVVSLLYHRRTLEDLFLEPGPPLLLGDVGRPIPTFDAAVQWVVPAEKAEIVERVTASYEAARMPGPTDVECAAAGGFFVSDAAAQSGDCFRSADCLEHRGCYDAACSAPCPHPTGPTPARTAGASPNRPL